MFVASTATEGHLARGLLEANGIPVLIKGETEGPYRVGPIQLWIPEAFEVQARLLLAETRSPGRGDEEREASEPPEE
ncbi:MAG: DUF2007 domain-containing protein [Actinobacteria bacterium]|nr:DUF2007 domain-containing protein [Actinomycetota bacterium]